MLTVSLLSLPFSSSAAGAGLWGWSLSSPELACSGLFGIWYSSELIARLRSKTPQSHTREGMSQITQRCGCALRAWAEANRTTHCCGDACRACRPPPLLYFQPPTEWWTSPWGRTLGSTFPFSFWLSWVCLQPAVLPHPCCLCPLPRPCCLCPRCLCSRCIFPTYFVAWSCCLSILSAPFPSFLPSFVLGFASTWGWNSSWGEKAQWAVRHLHKNIKSQF